MYDYLKGLLVDITPSYIVLDVCGVGYKIYVANPFQFSSKRNEEAKIYIHQTIREDAHVLYGFATFEERQLFERLIQVSGIGPKSALAIMASEDHEGLIQAVESSNITYLTHFPGVGKKTAQQMVLDLQGKMDELVLFREEMWDLAPEQETADAKQQIEAEAKEALQALGYSERDIKRVSKALVAETFETTDEYLRRALKEMIKK